MKPYYQDDYCTIFNADCRDVLPQLDRVDLILCDPPYGLKRFRKGFGSSRFRGHGAEKDGIKWDIAPEQQTLAALIEHGKEACIWGMNNLPLPTTEHFLVWDKQQTVDNFADAELAWCNYKKPAKVFHYAIHKHNQSKAGGHPTEKPVLLLTWCISLADDPQTILDPFMGSGTTLRAAKDLRRQAIGIEIEERYCEIAVKRLQQEVLAL